ncbi:unnamed protein product, partial [Urochloa humidicola]
RLELGHGVNHLRSASGRRWGGGLAFTTDAPDDSSTKSQKSCTKKGLALPLTKKLLRNYLLVKMEMTMMRAMPVQILLIPSVQALPRMHEQVEFLHILPQPVAVNFCACFLSPLIKL